MGEVVPHVGGEERRERRMMDASRISFPLQLTLLIVSSALASGMSIWVSLSGLRSDVRDIRTRMEMTAEISARDARLLEERFATLRESVATLAKEQRMQQLDLNALKDSVLTMGRTTR